jgi:hypothetical protein
VTRLSSAKNLGLRGLRILALLAAAQPKSSFGKSAPSLGRKVERQAKRGCRPSSRSTVFHPVTAIVFGSMQGGVGALQNGLDRCLGGGVDNSDSHADRYVHVTLVGYDSLPGYPQPDLFCSMERTVEIAAGSTRRNSSPPYLPTPSYTLNSDLSFRATSFSTASPDKCPNVSLTFLKWSMSASTTQTGRCSLLPRAISRSRNEIISARLDRCVMES